MRSCSTPLPARSQPSTAAAAAREEERVESLVGRGPCICGGTATEPAALASSPPSELHEEPASARSLGAPIRRRRCSPRCCWARGARPSRHQLHRRPLGRAASPVPPAPLRLSPRPLVGWADAHRHRHQPSRCLLPASGGWSCSCESCCSRSSSACTLLRPPCLWRGRARGAWSRGLGSPCVQAKAVRDSDGAPPKCTPQTHTDQTSCGVRTKHWPV